MRKQLKPKKSIIPAEKFVENIKTIPTIMQTVQTPTPSVPALEKKFDLIVSGCDWIDEPETFDRIEYIAEMNQLLKQVYNADLRQNRFALRLLADQMGIYMQCKANLAEYGLVTTYNNGATLGANPYLTASRESLSKIITMMNDIGLMPKNIFAHITATTNNSADDFLSGPKIKVKK